VQDRPARRGPLWLKSKARVADPTIEPDRRLGRGADDQNRRTAAWQTRPLPDRATTVAFSDVTARRAGTGLAQREAALKESRH
jgi:hypothetical protein